MFVYFPTRESLVDAVISEVARFYEETALSVARGGEDSVERLTRSLADTLVTQPGYARILHEWSIQVAQETWPQCLGHYGRMIAKFTDAIAQG